MLIGELAKHSGFSRDTIRYYEKLGLFTLNKTQNRATNSYKNYPLEILKRLLQIKLLKKNGFTLQEIYALFQSDGQMHVCEGLPAKLSGKVAAIENKIAELLAFKAALLQIHQACTEKCGLSNGIPTCIDTHTPKGKTST